MYSEPAWHNLTPDKIQDHIHLLPSALSRLMELQKKTGDKAIFSAFNKMDDRETIFSSSEYFSKRKWGILVSCDCYPYTLFNQFIGSAGFVIEPHFIS